MAQAKIIKKKFHKFKNNSYLCKANNKTQNNMEKLTFGQLVEKMYQHNEALNAEPIQAVIVFKSSNWPGKDYSLESRSYVVSSENKYFKDCIGNSLYGSALDGSDPGVRLDWYMNDSRPWAVDYCYIKN